MSTAVPQHVADPPTLSPEMLALAQVVADLVMARLGTLAALPDAPLRQAANDEWLTAESAARYLGMNTKALYSAVQRRQVRPSHLGRRLRFKQTELDDLLRQRPRRGVQRLPRVPSPGKDSERW